MHPEDKTEPRATPEAKPKDLNMCSTRPQGEHGSLERHAVEPSHPTPTRRRGAAAWLCWFCLLVGPVVCDGQHMHVAAEGGSDAIGGLFAYLTVQGKESCVTAINCSTGSVRVLFAKAISNQVILPPVCLSNGVVITTMEGTVTKYGLDGKKIFSAGVLRSNEVSRLNGRWDRGTIYLTAMHYDAADGEPRHRLLWIDVQGLRPVEKGETVIGPPLKVVRVEGDIVVCGSTSVERIAAPSRVSP
jgi:hypothetical protein